MRSAGLVLYRVRDGAPEVLLGHMGGPFWARKDEHAWSIPKGEHGDDEDPLAAARREFAEETGSPAPDGEPLALGEVRQSGGKRVVAWAVEGDLDPATVRSNTFAMEWPPRSGRRQEFPEIDRAAWFALPVARAKVVKGQVPLLDALERVLTLP
jgi:predicted NUDIX family NTP pyrophosphohydrolase